MRSLLRLATPIACSIFVVFLSGCDNEDTFTYNVTQEPSDVETVSSGTPTSVNIAITDVTIASPPVVQFTVTDQDGLGFVGLEPGEPSFMIAKLVPGTDGDPGHWQSYINAVEQPGVGPGTEDKIQAGTENGGTLENHNDGRYTYTFETDVTDVVSPIEVSYEPSLTHRVGIELRGDVPGANAVYTFQPSTGMTAGIDGRKIVKTETCNTCHGEMALHGGARFDTDMCVLCHNPGSADANSGNTVDFSVMVHKIHYGAGLPSVQDGGDYTIYGFGDRAHDYSDVHFPQDVRNCTTCHDPDDEETPQADNITMNPTAEACGACHDDVNFAEGESGGHAGGVVTDNAECASCHAPDRVAGGILENHEIPAQIAAANFEYNIIDITDTAPGESPQITFSITDPTNDDAAYDILNDPEFNSSETRIAVILAWDTRDYHNTDSGSDPGGVISINPLGSAVDNGDGTFTVTSSTAIPASATGSGMVGIEGHPAADPDGDGTYDLSAPVTGVVDYFPITDSEAQPRRQVVDLAKCQVCHGQNDGLALHGGNRTDSIELCVACHNANATDLAARPDDPDETDNEENANAMGGDEEESIDFKYMIHAIHGADKRTEDLIIYGFGNNAHNYAEVHMPRSAGDCDACHTEGTFELPLASTVLGTTVDTQATVANPSPFGTSDFINPGAAADPDDDANITPTAAACAACHTDTVSMTHMEQNGANFAITQSNIDEVVVETCTVCHGPGRSADVSEVHGLAE